MRYSLTVQEVIHPPHLAMNSWDQPSTEATPSVVIVVSTERWLLSTEMLYVEQTSSPSLSVSLGRIHILLAVSTLNCPLLNCTFFVLLMTMNSSSLLCRLKAAESNDISL